MQVATAVGLIQQMNRIGYTVFHHGDCVGSDEQLAGIAFGLGGFIIVSHPCDIESKRAHFPSSGVMDIKPPMDRNDDMVAVAGWVLATPKGMNEEVRSGTWATIRRARRASCGLTIIYPDGTLGD